MPRLFPILAVHAVVETKLNMARRQPDFSVPKSNGGGVMGAISQPRRMNVISQHPTDTIDTEHGNICDELTKKAMSVRVIQVIS